MKIAQLVLICGFLAGLSVTGHSTIIGFGQLGGNNVTVPAGLGSNATSNGSGFVITNGATPNIALTWDPLWDIHTSTFFTALENKTVGGGSWDNEGSIPRVGQLDVGNHSITFAAAPGTALLLNSFDFAQTAETSGITTWDLTLRDSHTNLAWSQSLTLNNALTSTVVTVAPNFTGALGETYTLTFNRTSQSYNSDGRHAIDNLSFNQVPEPSSTAFVVIGAVGLLSRRRKEPAVAAAPAG